MRVPAFFIATAALFNTTVLASTPQGKTIGFWMVSSINSMGGGGSGAEADAAAGISQTHGESKLSVDWDQLLRGKVVEVSAEFPDCFGEDSDFIPSYEISVERWLRSGRKIERRIAEDFRVWLKQASFACVDQTDINRFNLDKIKPAVRDFTTRLSYFSSYN